MAAKPKETAEAEAPAEAPADTAAAEPDANGSGLDFVDDLPEDEHKTERDSKYASAVTVLRANPGKWAKIVSAKNRNGARTRCYQLRKKYDDTTGLEWDYRNSDVYGRYVAPVEDADAKADAK